MKPLHLVGPDESLSVLCLGAHSDDIEIGVGATLLGLIARGVRLDVRWCVLSGEGERHDEAKASAEAFLAGARNAQIEIMDFRTSYFPEQSDAIKTWFEALKVRSDADIVFTHRRDDAHQDHREINRLTWNSFRNHSILEYEIPKWDGDFGQPNLYVQITAATLQRKIDLLMAHFGTQRSKHWFDEETFRGLARLRGIECGAAERYAEAFFARKLTVV